MSKALDGAWRKGRAAREARLPITACPYEDHRTPSNKVSWSRAFIRAWQHGWHNRHPPQAKP